MESKSVDSSSTKEPTVQQLIKLKADYIKKCDFNSARKTEEAINEKRESNAKDNFDSICLLISEHIQTYYDHQNLAIKSYQDEYKAQVKEYRLKVDSLFQNFQARHLSELIKIEETYAHQILKEKDRSIPKYNELIKQAQGLAKANDFDGALRIQDKAEKIKATDFQQRRMLIDKKFNSLREKVYERQKNELLSLNQKLSSYLSYCKKKFDEKVEQENEQFRVSIIREEKSAIFSSTKSVKDKNSKIKMADSITNYIIRFVKELTGEDFQISHRSSTSRSISSPHTPNSHLSRASTPRHDNNSLSNQDIGNDESL